MNIDGDLFAITLVSLTVQGMLDSTRICFFIDALLKDKACILMFRRVDEHVACLLYGPLNLVWTKMPSGVSVCF